MMDITPDWNSATPLVILLIALIVDGLIGSLPGIRVVLGMPLSAVRGLTGWFDRRLNRSRRGGGALRVRGLVATVIIVVLAWVAGAAIVNFSRSLPHGWLLEAFCVLALLRQRDTIARMRRAAHALVADDHDEARAAAGHLVRYDAGALDDFGVARATIEGGVIRFTEGCLGTVFWFLLLGLPALCAYRAVTAAADVIGRPSPRHAAFGFVPSRLDDALTLAPAIIAGPVLACAALFVPPCRPFGSFGGWARDLRERGARAAFRAEGALAGALGIALGGPRPFDGDTIPGTWIGEGRARATVADIRRAVLLITIACLLVALMLALALIARTG